MRLTTVVSQPPHVLHLARVGAVEPQPRFLHGVLGLAPRAQHPLRHRTQVRAVLLELLGLPLLCVHRSHPLAGARQRGDEPHRLGVTNSEETTVNAIEAHELHKTYPGGAARRREESPSRFLEGEVFGLLGPNGAGKSTTVGMLTTTIVPTSGTARLAGHDVARSPLLARGVSSVVFQEAVVDRGLSGYANLELHTRLWGVPANRAKRRIAELVQAFGLSELVARPVASYSGGERRRLEIARALLLAAAGSVPG